MEKLVNKKILIFVDSDVVIRHFIENETFSLLGQDNEVKIIYPDEGYKRINNYREVECEFEKINVRIPEKRALIWKRKLFLDQLSITNGGAGEIKDLKKEIRIFRKKTLGKKTAILYSIFALPIIKSIVNHIFDNQLNKMQPLELKHLLEKEQPDLILHPSTFDGYFINDVINLGKKHRIPSVLLMNSWDNPVAKRTVLEIPDAVVVWGPQSRKYSESLMKIPSNQVYEFGAAQFEIFKDSPSETREEFSKEYNIGSEKKILLYAGSSKGNQESLHLEWLDESIKNQTVQEVVIIYKPHPYGIDKDQAEKILNKKYDHVIIEKKSKALLSALAKETHHGFFRTSYANTHNILSNCDAVVSPLSTIIIEAGLHRKPAMCFIPIEEDEGSIWESMRKQMHFRDLINCPEVVVAKSQSEFIPKIKLLLDRCDDLSCKEKIFESMKYFCQMSDESYSQNISNLCNDIILKQNAA
tara:strand:- start:1113 stop:2522 length:1410 start_codon:yes stop_codon:yes gene_type:complete